MKSNPPFLSRVRLFSIACIAATLLLLGKLYFVQIVDGNDYAEKGKRQYAHANEELWNRGAIFFSAKNGELVSGATLKTGLYLVIRPDEITDPVLLKRMSFC
ncbi:MAG: hypothetical protein UY62_C0058G0002 [Parcubacteria group bacterium GW2011_GWF2_50_9]|nr:MAG: hypothetical protein UY62_C0058G0002 [Parcubacteria group bacterium GW2011_GWF2_50_9]